MEILRGPDPRLRHATVTWGVFDGVHVGHRKVLRRLVEMAGSRPSAVITFDRHPAEVLHGREVPLVLPLEERLRRIGESGVGFVIVLSFTMEFAQTTAEQFVRDFVVGRLGASEILLGHDSHFGKNRQGDFDMLVRLGKEIGVRVETCEPEMYRGRPMSSSLVREAVAEGRLEEAAEILGRPFAMWGRVLPGDRRGSSLGFPTANLEVTKTARPPRGVYAVEAVVDGRAFPAVANLGRRPTFHGEDAPEVLEVHLLDFPGGDLYGRTLEVRFLYRVRDEKKFAGPAEIRKQIEADIAAVRARGRS